MTGEVRVQVWWAHLRDVRLRSPGLTRPTEPSGTPGRTEPTTPPWATGPTGLGEPTERTGPAAPTGATEPTGLGEPTERTGPAAPTGATEPTGLEEPTERTGTPGPPGRAGPIGRAEPTAPPRATEPTGLGKPLERASVTTPSGPTGGVASAGLAELLDPVERARYEAIFKPADRERFLVGCALSRIALGELLGLPPAEVPLRRVCPRCGGPHGKPALEVPHGPPRTSPYADIDFSVTHSGDIVGVAVSRGAAVGLDVEETETGNGTALDVDTVAPVALTDGELAALNARPAAERASAFLRTWTRKEAVLKALGVGLTVPLRQLEVSAPELPPTVLAWPDQLTAPPRLAMADMDVQGTAHPPAIAAVAVLGASGVRLDPRDGTDAVAAYGASTAT